MNKLDKISLSDILRKTNMFLTTDKISIIWKADTPDKIANLGRIKIEEMTTAEELDEFIMKFGNFIDNTQLVIGILLSYEEQLKQWNITNEDIKVAKEGIKTARELLKDIDEDYLFIIIDEENLISSILIVNTEDLSKGISRKDKNDNVKRLQELNKQLHFSNVTQSIFRQDFETIIPNKNVAKALLEKVEYNPFARVLKNVEERQKLSKTNYHELAKGKKPSLFVEDINSVLRDNVEEVDFDKLLLCSSYRYIQSLEEERITPEGIPAVFFAIQTMQKHIRNEKTRITDSHGGEYKLKDLSRDLKRFIMFEKDMSYLKRSDCKEIEEALLSGQISLKEWTPALFDAMNLRPITISKIVKRNPEDYIFLCKEINMKFPKSAMLKDIKNANKCSPELFQLLLDETDITPEEIRDLFDKEIITVAELQSATEKMASIITNENLFEKYQNYKEATEDKQKEDARVSLERYCLAYRNTELLGKTDQEIVSKGEEFVNEFGGEIASEDLIPLYDLDIIPLKVAVDWGGEDIIEKLLESESLKPLDAKYLRDEGLIDKDVLIRLFEKSKQMSYAYQVALVYTIFDGTSKEEQEAKEELAQYYNIENALDNYQKNGGKGTKRKTKDQAPEIPKERIKMRDPGAKYNLLSSLDKNLKIEDGIIDGHIIFHYPNIDAGAVLIEKLHKISKDKLTGTTEIRADNESATYVLSEEEFIKLKPELIKQGKIDRTQLTQRWWVSRDPKHWLPHAGTSAWENSLKERFEVNAQNPRYAIEDITKIDELIQKSIDSKKQEDR